MKRSLFGFRPTRHLALGLGAAGLVLGASGASAAATALIQPAGALSVQVPAVAVREQNVNAAGRIRVALPKTSVGVNGSVSVSNLPVNSAGRVQVQNGTATTYQAEGFPTVGTSAQTIVNVTGTGNLKFLEVGDAGSGSHHPWYLGVTVITDGHEAWYSDVGGQYWIGNNTPGASFTNINEADGYGLTLALPGGIPFEHALQVILAVFPGHSLSSVNAHFRAVYSLS